MIAVDVVIVTYNRIEKLKKALKHYNDQSSLFRNIIVVNNASNDGTFEFLDVWKKECTSYGKYVLNLKQNLGGSGGFHAGQEFALGLQPDWIYLADDDAYADRDLFLKFYNYLSDNDTSEISAICAKILNSDGTIAFDHRSRLIIKNSFDISIQHSELADYEGPAFLIDLLSYVGSFLNVCALKKVGLVNPRYFIYADDGEHSLRLRNVGSIVCVPSLIVLHDSGQNSDVGNGRIVVSWRDYYAIRNYLHMMKKHYCFYAIILTIRYCRYIVTNKSVDCAKRRLYKGAIIDAWANRLGMHLTYRPGWQVLKHISG